MLEPGKRGLGFAVGQEPLSSLFAQYGADILATDLYTADAQANGWVETGQHAEGFEAINKRGLCDDEELRRRVEFKFANMNHITPDLHGEYDFLWSSCALEHLGSLQNGIDFILNSLACLRPGGIAVHTTEFNVSSNSTTVEHGDTVLYRKCDIESLVSTLRKRNCTIDIDWKTGSTYADGFVDIPPYKHETHLKLQIDEYVVTSIGLIIRKSKKNSGRRSISNRLSSRR